MVPEGQRLSSPRPNGPAGPSATYRLQVTAEFSLFDAAAVTGYLAELGVGAVYVSPLLRSTTSYPWLDPVVDRSRGET